MPVCKHCGTTLASADMRRSPKQGWLCKDKIGCEHDRKIRRKGGDPGPRSLQSLLRF